MDEKLLKIINKVLSNKNKETINVLDDSHHLQNDIGLDSLDLAELTVRVENEFGVDIFEDGIVSSVAEVKNKLK